MAFQVVMPRLGWTMETGSLVEWRKADGQPVEAGEILFAVESDKAVQEVEAVESGVLRIPPDSPPPGKSVPVGTLLAYLVQPGEDFSFEAQSQAENAAKTGGAAPQATPADLASTSTPATDVRPSGPTASASAAIEVRPVGPAPCISPRARRVARELGVDWQALKGSGRTGRIVERDVRQAAAQAAQVPAGRASPLARRLAQELGVDVQALAARVPGRRVTRADVEAAARERGGVAPPVATPMSQMRRTILERMATSARTTAPVTLTTEADATELVRLRATLKSDPRLSQGRTPGYTDILVMLAARALAEHPDLNARLEGGTIVRSQAVHIGIAVDTERGLLVPVLRHVQAMRLRQIAEASAALVERARQGTLGLQDLQGGTFTVTNLGMFEIDAFTPIINLPECAILGVGRIVPKQIVVEAEAARLAIRHMVTLSLTFDHRLVDGAPAARFLQRLKHLVEQPYLCL